MNICNIRLLSQQLAAPQFSEPHEVVRWMGFMQAQDYRMMRWAVAMRIKRPSLRKFAEDYDAGRIIRTHLFRMTWQLVHGEDLRWMQDLCRERNWRMLKGWMAQFSRKLPEKEERDMAFDAIRNILHGRSNTTRDELFRQMKLLGIPGDTQQYSHLLCMAEIEGLVCSGTLHPTKNTYALVEERITSMPIPTHEEALTELARRYFLSHGPATLDDFSWWTELCLTDCRKGMEDIASELTEVKYKGQVFYYHRMARTHGCRESYILLPSFDEYLIGYKSRHIVLDEAFAHHAYTKNGIFHPVILHRGQVIGIWHPRHRQCSFFHPEDEAELCKQFGQYEKCIRQQ